MKKLDIKKFRLTDLFYKEKFVIVLSIVLAFAIWLIISSNETESRPITISDIPIKIELSDTAISDGLKVFSGNNLTSEVSVIGNRIIVGQLSKSDIKVVARQANSITAPGNYTLELTAQKASNLTDYEFSSGVNPGFITVMVDRYKEVEFNVEDGIKYKSDPKYFAGSTVFSSPKVKISGPESEISKVNKIVAEAEISDVLEKTKNLTAPLIMYDSYGDVISNENIVLSVNYEDVTIPILSRKVLPITPVFKNNPEVITPSSGRVKLNPDSMEIAAPEEIFETMTTANLVPIDFSTINLDNTTFDLSLDLPIGCKSISNIYNVSLTIDLSGYSSASKMLSTFEFINLPEDKQAVVSTKELPITIIGASSQVNNVASSDIIGQIDMSEKKNFTGSTEVPLKIKINNHNTCWTYGEYKVNIEVSEKT